MELEKKLETALKRKTVLRETLHNTTGYKAKKLTVSRVDKYWYGFNIDGYYFECRWESAPWMHTNQAKFWFRENKELEKAGFCNEYGIDVYQVKYASSLHFGYGTDIIKCLWLIGEVLTKKSSYDFHREQIKS